MTAEDFRRLALALPGATEQSHQRHPDFRLGTRIFATLGYPDADWGMVNLSPDDQHVLTARIPDGFTPASGAWGRQGCTLARLAQLDEPAGADALQKAWTKATGQ